MRTKRQIFLLKLSWHLAVTFAFSFMRVPWLSSEVVNVIIIIIIIIIIELYCRIHVSVCSSVSVCEVRMGTIFNKSVPEERFFRGFAIFSALVFLNEWRGVGT